MDKTINFVLSVFFWSIQVHWFISYTYEVIYYGINLLICPLFWCLVKFWSFRIKFYFYVSFIIKCSKNLIMILKYHLKSIKKKKKKYLYRIMQNWSWRNPKLWHMKISNILNFWFILSKTILYKITKEYYKIKSYFEFLSPI